MTPNKEDDLVDCFVGQMTFEEIEEFFRENGMSTALQALLDSAAEETKSLEDYDLQAKGSRTPSGRDREKDARDFLAEDICGFLNGSLELTPETVLAHRPRVVNAWALAELIKEKRQSP